MLDGLAKRHLIDRVDWAAKYFYVFFSLADAINTILDRTLVGTPEATPVYRELMARLGDGAGFAVALSLEYLLVFGVHKVLPAKWKPLPFIIPAYIHCMGSLAHFDILTHHLPGLIHTLVWFNVLTMNSFIDILTRTPRF